MLVTLLAEMTDPAMLVTLLAEYMRKRICLQFRFSVRNSNLKYSIFLNFLKYFGWAAELPDWNEAWQAS